MKNIPLLIGGIIGDTIGSVYEFDKTLDYDFDMYRDDMQPTDDSIMTLAEADWILSDSGQTNKVLIQKLKEWGHEFPWGGYGGMFCSWLFSSMTDPYNSFGNGSAMRCSACGYACDNLEDTLELAKRSAAVTHNHPEGIKGAQATAGAIFLARNGKSKTEIMQWVEETFEYDLDRTCAEIQPTYYFDETCQRTVPEAIIAFLDSKDYEDAIRLSISLGGDADTLACITGSIAAAFYREIPDKLVKFVLSRLPKKFLDTISEFDRKYNK